MNKTGEILEFFVIIIGISLFLFGLIIGLGSTLDMRYKQGQIDVLTGKINYHLVTKIDSTKTWEKITK